MTDHTDLIARLRKLSEDSVGNYGMPVAGEAADALEAQGREIERLNGACKSYEIQANRDALRLAERLAAYCVCSEQQSPVEGCDCVCCTTTRLEARLAEAEALLREASIHLRYHDVAAGLREMIDAFLGRDK